MIERIGRSDRKEELRLGWLDAFLAVAHHLDYGLAGEELGMAPDNVRRCVRRLEKWSGRTLMDSSVSLTLHEPDGSEFILLAVEALKEFGVACGKLTGRAPTVILGDKTDLRLSDLQRIIHLAKSGNYIYALDRNRNMNIRRNIIASEKTLGAKLFSDEAKLIPTPEVLHFIESIERIVGRLQGFQKSMKDILFDILTITKKQREAMREAISEWKGRKKLSPIARRDMEYMNSTIGFFDNIINELEKICDIPHKNGIIKGSDTIVPKIGKTGT